MATPRGRGPKPARAASAPPTGPDRRALAIAAIAIVAVWLALFAPQIFGHQVFVLGDARVYKPFADFSRERWEQLHVRTFWNPYVLCGIAASASLADMRAQYLPDALLTLVEHLRPGPWWPLAGPLLAHLAGMFAVATLAWAMWDLPAVALVFAALAFGLTPLVLVPFAFGHDAFFAACALMPVLLLGVWAVFAAPTRRGVAGAALAVAIVAGVQALTGHPQVVVYSGLLAVAFGVDRAARSRRFGRLLPLCGALAWGAAISAALWLPALHYGASSNRGGSGVPIAQVLGMSLRWYELATLAWPQAVGGESVTYWGGFQTTDYPRFFGTLVVALAIAAMCRPRARRPAGSGFLLGVTLVAVALALGPRLGPIYTIGFRALPFFDKFRTTSMGLVVGSLACTLLAASAFARREGDVPARGAFAGAAPRVVLAIGLAAIALGAALATGALAPGYVAFARAMRPAFDPARAAEAAHRAGVDLLWRGPLLIAGVAMYAAWRRRARFATPAAVALVVLLLADLLPVSLPTLRRGTATSDALEHPVTPALVEVGQQHPESRVLSVRTYDVSSWEVAGSGRSAELRINDWIRWHVHAYGGEHGTPPRTWTGMEALASIDAMRALGIGYVSNILQAPMDTSVMTPVLRGPDELVWHLKDDLTRAYTPRSVVALDADTAVFRRLVSPGFDPAAASFTSDTAAAGEYPGSEGATVTWVRDSPDSLELDVTAGAPAFLVIADSWFPGWSATLDGAPVAIHRVNFLARGLGVPAGTHHVAMTYVPEGWRVAVPVTRAALLGWLLAALAWLAWGAMRPGARGAVSAA